MIASLVSVSVSLCSVGIRVDVSPNSRPLPALGPRLPRPKGGIRKQASNNSILQPRAARTLSIDAHENQKPRDRRQFV